MSKLKMTKAMFPEQMEVWLIAEQEMHIKEFQEVFHRKIRFIRDLNELVQAVDQSPKYTEGGEQFIYASLIFYRALPEAVVSELTNVVKILDIIEKLNVYEVERDDKIYEDSYQYGSLRQLEVEYKGLDRTQYVQDLPDGDKQKRVLEELDIEVARLKENLQSNEEAYTKLTKEYQDLQRRNQDLESQIDTEVNVNSKRMVDELEDVKRRLQTTEDDLDLAQDRLLKNQQKIRELTESKENLEYTLEAKDRRKERLKEEIEFLKSDYQHLEEDHIELQEERANLLSMSAGTEQRVAMLEENERYKIERNQLRKELHEVKLLLREEEISNKDLERVLEEQRKGQVAQRVTGRTYNLDTYKLKNTDLVYIKVVDNLVYHRSAISSLFDQLNELYNNRARLVVLSFDDGLDKYRYEGMQYYHSIDDVDIRDIKYRLHPSPTMFTGIDHYEHDIDLLFIVDYTGGNQYYVSTESRSNIMTMVRYSGMLKDDKLGLKGLPLTMGTSSVYDLTHDERIARSGAKRTRDRMIGIKTKEWIDKLNVKSY